MGIETIRHIETIQKQLRNLMAQESEGGSGGTTVASQAEVDTGTDFAKIVTPLTLANATSVLQGVNAGDGIASDGSSSPTISLDINGLTAEASADNADTIAIYDDTASEPRKQSRTNFLSGIGGWPFNNIKTVSAAAGATYPSIPAAITGMTAGDIILVDAGIWTSSLTMSKAGAFIALSPEKTTITTGTTDDTIDVTSDNVIIDGFTITNSKTGADRACITSGNDNLIVKNCIVTKTGAATNSYGIRNTGGAGWKLENTTATVSGGTNNYGYRGDTSASDVDITHSILDGTNADLSLNHASSAATLKDATLNNGTVDGSGTLNGTLDGAILVNNASGAIPDRGDVGFLDEAGDYQETTTEGDNVAWCVVEIGNIDAKNIFVRRRGETTVNYTGSAPNAGDFLITSTSAGLALASATMRPEIFAVCTAAGSGGTVAIQLLTGTVSLPITGTADIFGITTGTDSDFSGTIAALPGGAAVRYSTTGGDEGNLKPKATNQLSKIRLFNSTRSEYALISDNNPTGGGGYDGEITLTANVPGTWATTDVITIRSQTNTSTVGGASYFMDFEITSEVDLLARGLALDIAYRDSGVVGESMRLHPWEANNNAKRIAMVSLVASTSTVRHGEMSLINNRFTALWTGSGASTVSLTFRVFSQMIASP